MNIRISPGSKEKHNKESLNLPLLQITPEPNEGERFSNSYPTVFCLKNAPESPGVDIGTMGKEDNIQKKKIFLINRLSIKFRIFKNSFRFQLR